MNIEQKVFDIVASIIKQPILNLDENSGLNLTPGWDSLAHTMLVLSLEKEFDVGFDFDELEEIISIKFIIQALLKKDVGK